MKKKRIQTKMLDTTYPLTPGEVIEETRPWGRFRTVLNGTYFKVKTLHIRPSCRLSLQSHRFRSEHWILVAGEVSAIVAGTEHQMKAGDHMFVPVATIHRLQNSSHTDEAVVLEVQQGLRLFEDDIDRYHDDFGRQVQILDVVETRP